MATRTSTQSGSWSSPSTWGGSAAPVAGDKAIISSGNTVTVDSVVVVGSKVAGIGINVEVKATDAVTFGVLQVASNGSLTLRGFDFVNPAIFVNQYAKWNADGGAQILFDYVSDGQTQFNGGAINYGRINFTGTNGNNVICTVPPGNIFWNTAGTLNLTTITAYDLFRNIYGFYLGKPFISNAANTGLGSFGNSSISFGSVSPGGNFTTEVATLSAVTSIGKYFVDYMNGVVYLYSTVNVTSSITFKYLVSYGGGIDAIQDLDYNSVIFNYVTFNYWGSAQDDVVNVLRARYKQTTGYGGNNRNLQITNCTFNYCKKPFKFDNNNGTVLDPINFNNNTLNGFYTNIGGGYGDMVLVGGSSQAGWSYQNNYISTFGKIFNFIPDNNSAYQNANWIIKNNIIHCFCFIEANDTTWQFPDSVIEKNYFLGFGFIGGSRMIAGYGGTSGHRAILKNNTIDYPERHINYSSYLEAYNNYLLNPAHHGVSAPSLLVGITCTDILFHNNVMNFGGTDGGLFEWGYNSYFSLDAIQCYNNTFISNQSSVAAAITLGDALDTGAMLSAFSLGAIYNNIIMNNITGMRRSTTLATSLAVGGLTINDYNNLYNNTADYANFNQFSSFTNANGFYNVDNARNILGAVLYDPNYSSASGKTLALTVSSGQYTLVWDGGAGKTLRKYNSTATGASNTDLATGVLNDTTQTFPTALNNALCPLGMWVKILSGTGAGQVRRITNCDATSVTVASPWTIVPDNTSAYAMYLSEVQLFDSGASNYVRCGIDMRTMPTSSQSDTGIGLTTHHIAVDPQLVDITRNSLTYDTSLGGTGDEYDLLSRMLADFSLITAIQAYLAAGYTPRNKALKGTGYQGADIGALGVLNPNVSNSGGLNNLSNIASLNLKNVWR